MPRLDRLATLYLTSPLMYLLGPGQGSRVPILMYHSLSHNLFGRSHPFYQINTKPEVFSEQMRWLRNKGYRSMGLQSAWAALASGAELSKTFVLTFDDGYRDFYTEGFAILKQCGFSATLLLATDRIRRYPARYEGVDYLTWRDVRELHREGFQFGSHTVTHPDLRSLEPEQIEYELAYSKEVIEQELGETVDTFSYPFSFPEEDKDFTRFLGDTLENLGFENGVSNMIGRARRESNPYFLPRMPINSWDSLDLLEAKLLGGYDWMHIPQQIHRLVNHNITLMQTTDKQATYR